MAEAQDSVHFLDYWRVIRARKELIIAITLFVVAVATTVTLTLPKTYMASMRIEVRRNDADLDVWNQQLVSGFNLHYLKTQYEIIQSRKVIYPVIEKLGLHRDAGKSLPEMYKTLRGAMQVQQFRDTSLVEIRIFMNDPELAAGIANEIAHTYADVRLESAYDEVMNGLEALKREIEKQAGVVNDAEGLLSAARESSGISVSVRQPLDANSLQQLEARRVNARLEMLEAETRLNELESLEGEELMQAITYTAPNSSVEMIHRELIETEARLNGVSQTYGENHPEVVTRKAVIAQLQEKGEAAVNGVMAGLRTAYKMSRDNLKAIEDELERATQTAIDKGSDKYLAYSRAERTVKLQRNILEVLQTRLAQEAIETALPSTPVDVIDRAEIPKIPVRPNVPLNIVLSVFFGLGTAIALAYFLEYLDTSVKTVEEIERATGAAVLGVIPQKVRPMVQEKSESRHAESYRLLRTNLGFATRQEAVRSYCVTSGAAGEGKSLTVANLAYVSAQLGARVLIVDADLHRPTQHGIWKVANETGLVDLLSGKAEIADCIVETSVANLSLLPSGKIPHTTAGLVSIASVGALERQLKEMYDMVVFDAPPIMGVSDASVLVSQVDGVLLVVQPRKYPMVMLNRAKSMVHNVGGRLIGITMNNVNIAQDYYYYYYHSNYEYYLRDRPPAERKAV